jgi:hypothetical protein
VEALLADLANASNDNVFTACRVNSAAHHKRIEN